MRIRLARPGEADVLTALVLRSKAYWGYDDAFLAASRDDLVVGEDLIESGRVVVAELGESVVGVASLMDEPPEIELGHLFVAPENIASGVGRVLFGAVVDEARRRSAHALMIESDPHAEAFYVAMGAELVGTRTSVVDSRRQLPLLRFQLA